jgi:beta-aspartyl-peptidase (threonine type)
VGWAVLTHGGSAVDAVEAAVATLEDNPLFNAGAGSSTNSDGQVELDASIMDGAQGCAGAVASVTRIRNPIRLARRIMQDQRHILLAGEGAERFACAQGMTLCDPQELIDACPGRSEEQHGTVGCVALDHAGRIAAATSTGGIANKLAGRVGDSALIGCGTYANHHSGVSCTGIGEAIIRVVLAKTLVDLMRPGVPIQVTAKQAIGILAEQTGDEGGVIVVNERGDVGYARNTTHMPVCWVRDGGDLVTDI